MLRIQLVYFIDYWIYSRSTWHFNTCEYTNIDKSTLPVTHSFKGEGKGVGVVWYQVWRHIIRLYGTFYPLVTGPVHSCVISTTPRGAYTPAAVSAHWTYRTHFYLCLTRYSFSTESSEAFEGEVSCPRTHHLNNFPRLRGEKHVISLKILHQAGFETARQAATSPERHALTIAPCPSLYRP